ncbi:hypothetical protein H7F15_09115 [Pontibacter sp. Tf4]|uniref:hypothetical protein n=1 Tax=Pontibacter sp. Tf4 TaxID=2761620 RepID=UPI0016248403|nr:hypothetical protein [Pontibacter sp. Tf4]MBB6611195.1 hypothetical protein [Pontibacter sp. Tf4]
MSNNTLMRLWQELPSGARLLTVLAFVLLMTGACTRREAFPEESDEIAEADADSVAYDGQLLAQVVFDSIDYIVPPLDLMQPFITEFGDGTVVDKVMIHKVQEAKQDKAGYYLVGMGIRNGSYRAMALQLDVASDNSLYLSSKSKKFICGATAGCSFCFFTFSGNQITGCECESRAAGSFCEQKFSDSNQLLKNARLRNTRDDETRNTKDLQPLRVSR